MKIVVNGQWMEGCVEKSSIESDRLMGGGIGIIAGKGCKESRDEEEDSGGPISHM